MRFFEKDDKMSRIEFWLELIKSSLVFFNKIRNNLYIATAFVEVF